MNLTGVFFGNLPPSQNEGVVISNRAWKCFRQRPHVLGYLPNRGGTESEKKNEENKGTREHILDM